MKLSVSGGGDWGPWDIFGKILILTPYRGDRLLELLKYIDWIIVKLQSAVEKSSSVGAVA